MVIDGCLDFKGSYAGGERRDGLDGIRQRSEHGDAGQVHQLAELLETQRHAAIGHQRTHGHARRRHHDARADLLEDAPAREKLLQVHAAGAGGIAQRARGASRPQTTAAQSLILRRPAPVRAEFPPRSVSREGWA